MESTMTQVTILTDAKVTNIDLGCLHEIFGSKNLFLKGIKPTFISLDELSNLPFHGQLLKVINSDVLITSGFNQEKMGAAKVAFDKCLKLGGEIHIINNRDLYSELSELVDTTSSSSDKIHQVSGGLKLFNWAINLIKLKFGLSIGSDVVKIIAICPSELAQLKTKYDGDMQACSQNFREALLWAEKNLDKVLTIEQVANKACLSRRAFDRKFKEAFNRTPKSWLTNLKLEKAKYYLENSDIGIEKVAQLSGFGNYINLRNCFSKNLGEPPSFYRIINKTQLYKA